MTALDTRRRRTPAVTQTRWVGDASCAEVDPELFFEPGIAAEREAKEVCAGCLMRQACLESALALPIVSDFGVRGGLSVKERRRLRRGQPVPVISPSMARVLASRDLVEARVAAGVPLKMVARELGVGRETLRSARAMWAAQDKAVAA
ncbi:WhiB family transcriptional regulator [Streptomyces zhihengii]